jgi:dolichyl-phosphate beta-glucosyltransferase
VKDTGAIERPEVMMSVVVPAYNEEARMEIMLEEAVAFLDQEYGRTPELTKGRVPNGSTGAESTRGIGGYEILIVNDGSKDRTVDVALSFAKRNNLHDILRVCTLKENRGKGGAVTHGFRHVRGAYAVFADADGASKFEDLRKLVKGCQEVEDESGRGIAVGSRAHMVGTEAVVKVHPATPTTIRPLLTLITAISPQKCPHALLPPSSPPPHTPSYIPHPRHTMRIQALLSCLPSSYYPLHAR